MASFNGPKLTNPIRTDVPDTQEVLVALAKQDPTSISDIPVGAKRLYEASSGKWQWQEYNGSSWAPVPFLQHNVDQLDGYHAAIIPAANTVAVRNASGLLEDSITGNAATASSAATLSQTLPVNKGGTGGTTSAAARTNLGVPPTSHVSTATTYGVGNATQYGHVKLSDAANSSSGVTGGVAATPAAVKVAKDAADAAQSSANSAQSSANAAQSAADAAQSAADAAQSAADAAQSTADAAQSTADAAQSAADSNVKTVNGKAPDAAGNVALSADYIVETYRNGSSWYDIYKSGRIKQGGKVTVSSDNYATITFLKMFANTDYHFTAFPVNSKYTENFLMCGFDNKEGYRQPNKIVGIYLGRSASSNSMAHKSAGVFTWSADGQGA